MENNESLPGGENLDLTLEYLKSEDGSVLKDFMSLRDTFSREIDLKEKKRQSLIENIRQVELNQIKNCKKIDLLDKNIQIYDKNIEEIETRMARLVKRENWIKKNYSDIVSGSIDNPKKSFILDNPGTLPETFYNLFKENVKARKLQGKSKLEELKNQKEKFLETLKNLLEEYDNELSTINEEIKHLKELDDEIETKKKDAIYLKKELNENNNSMKEQVLKDKNELKETFDEEDKLIKEFQKIIQRIKADINVSDVTMDILFSSKKPDKKEELPEDQEAVPQESTSSGEIAI